MEESNSRQREQQFLEPIRSPPKIKPFTVFDLESKDGDSQLKGFTRPFMLGYYDGIAFKCFRNHSSVKTLNWQERAVSRGGCIDLFMRHILGEPGSGTSPLAGHDIYAHNMGSFDGLFLPAWLERNHTWVSYKIMPIQSRVQSFEIWKHNKNRLRTTPEQRKKADSKDRSQYGVIRILDSFRIMPAALDKMAKAFGLEGKLKMDLDVHEDDPLWEQYNEIDCVQLYETVKKYHELVLGLGGEVGTTAPSTAIKLLRRKYLTDDMRIHRNIHFENCNSEESCQGCAHEFFRSAYFGGRTEIFKRLGHGWYFDINSSYPYSMTLPQPIGEMYELGENEDFTKFTIGRKYVGFVRCTVEIPENTYLPPLPVQHGGKLKFPAGTFSGTWDWIELNALKRIGGKILHVEKSVWVRAHDFLTDFVNALYAMRRKGDPKYKGPALSEVAKLILNSTFGKFGMDQNRMEMLILKPNESEDWELRYPGESDAHRHKRKRAAREQDNSYAITTRFPSETDEEFYRRQKLERKSKESKKWHAPNFALSSGFYEHDSLIRVRDITIDAAYIIPQIAAHITASSRILLWSYAMDILDLGHEIFYCDSVEENRCIPLLAPNGKDISVIPVKEAWNLVQGDVIKSRGKEFLTPVEEWKTLAKDSSGKQGWFPLKRIIRHMTEKEMHLISSKRGQVHVTQDHSIVVDNAQYKPQEFVEKNLQFETLSAPRGRSLTNLNLYKEVKCFKRVNTFGCDNEFKLDGQWATWSNIRKTNRKILCCYRPGSPEFHAFLRVLAAYITEGSASIKHFTTLTRDCFSICNATRRWLVHLKKDLKVIAPDTHFSGPTWSNGSNVYWLRSGSSHLPAFFGTLAGCKSLHKKLPSFIYRLSKDDFNVFWEMMVEGDGALEAGGEMSYSTISLQLMSGLSFALKQHGIEHAISYRPDKKAYTLRTRPADSERMRWTTKHEVSSINGYVYDLEVDGAHTFVDALGCVLLHNTDSLLTSYGDFPESKELGGLKKEYQEPVTIESYAPKMYRLNKATPFEGSHEEREGKRICLDICFGCKPPTDEEVKSKIPLINGRVAGQHALNEHGQRDCLKKCPGCSLEKVMMKGVPKNMRNYETIEKLLIRREEVSYQQHQKLGVLAKDGFRHTPQMQTIRKSMKSQYDKRIMNQETGQTKPIILNEPGYTTLKYKQAVVAGGERPAWLIELSS